MSWVCLFTGGPPGQGLGQGQEAPRSRSRSRCQGPRSRSGSRSGGEHLWGYPPNPELGGGAPLGVPPEQRGTPGVPPELGGASGVIPELGGPVGTPPELVVGAPGGTPWTGGHPWGYPSELEGKAPPRGPPNVDKNVGQKLAISNQFKGDKYIRWIWGGGVSGPLTYTCCGVRVKSIFLLFVIYGWSLVRPFFSPCTFLVDYPDFFISLYTLLKERLWSFVMLCYTWTLLFDVFLVLNWF